MAAIPGVRRAALVLVVVAALAVGGLAWSGHPVLPVGSAAQAATGPEVKVLLGAPASLDPAVQGDAGSAAITAQLFESLTTFEASLTLQPALAQSWQVDPSGRRVTFTLRPTAAFSDGTPITAADVVRSWLRVLDPQQPSPLAALLDSVTGAKAYSHGQGDQSAVGLHAIDSRHVEVDLDRPTADFPSVVASPTFGIVPPSVGDPGSPAGLAAGASFVASGGYRLAAVTDTELTLEANPHYWAGVPAIRTVHVLTTIGGQSPVAAFEAGDVDYTGISDLDAGWAQYNATLGPQLRSLPSISLVYFGFDTSRPPFNDVRVRRAFAEAVDWKRIVALGSTGTSTPATSMVPPGIVGRSERDFSPAHDPAAARKDLAAAGFPGGRGFPTVVLGTGGTGYEDAIARQLEDTLGVTIQVETMPFDQYFSRLSTDPPQFWSLSWIADYPGSNDFLGLLLGSGESNNYGRWSNETFDAAIERAGATSDPAAQLAAFDDAQSVVQSEAPVIPVSYGTGWALSRTGLLGAGQNGLGLTRLAGLSWQP